MSTLDITNYKQKGLELHTAICKEVEPLAKASVYVPMPDRILMTQAQYDDMMKLSNMPNMYHSEDRMYKTPYNIMEVDVFGRNRMTFEEATKLEGKELSEWEKSVEGEEG